MGIMKKKMPMDKMDDDAMPAKPSLAVAYDVQRKNKKKKMAKGGMVPGAEDDMEPALPMAKPDNMRLPEDEIMADHFAHGGEVEDHYSSIADAILAKKRKKMADGGMVDLEANSEEGANMADEQNEDALLKEQYDDSQLSAQPMDSNEHGDDIESDKHDMVSRIRSKMKKRGY